MNSSPTSDAVLEIVGLVDHQGGVAASRLAAMAESDPELVTQGESLVITVAAVLAEASPTGMATHVTVVSEGDAYRASIPIGELIASGRLLLEDDGGIRLMVVEGRTLCWNVKDVVLLRVTNGKEPDDVPDDPTH